MQTQAPKEEETPIPRLSPCFPDNLATDTNLDTANLAKDLDIYRYHDSSWRYRLLSQLATTERS